MLVHYGLTSRRACALAGKGAEHLVSRGMYGKMECCIRLGMLSSMLIPFVLAALAVAILAQTDQWRKQNDRGNRYEGRIDIPVGKPDLELLSFAGWREPFTSDVILKVRFFLPTSAPVLIQGRELQDQTQYWMESKPADWRAGTWAEFGPWPTREVLRREGIPSENLGVVIKFHKATTAGEVLIPAFVYHSMLPALATKYTLHLRPNATLKKVTYVLYRIVNAQEVEVKTSSLVGDKVAGAPFLIELDVQSLSAGYMRLVLQAAYKNRLGELLQEYEFYHEPQIR
jgi:hypothetical protein